MEYKYDKYQAEVDRIGSAEWSILLRKFDDASLYQTWSYGAVRWGERNLSHILLKHNGEVVAMAQSRIMKIPLVGAGIAYIGWGPIWRRRDREANEDDLEKMVAALKEEYAGRRGLYLRVFPNEIAADSERIVAVFEKSGFDRKPRTNRTFLIDLSPSVEDLRQDLRRQWRQNLAKAEEGKLEFVEGTAEELYRVALSIYREMHVRKKFVEFIDTQEYVPMQRDLPDELKMRILICYHDAKAIAALTWSELGQTGIALVSATGSLALETKAAYLMWWRMIQLMKDRGLRYCDTGGIDPVQNPGGYQFKSGIAKKRGKDVVFVGQFDICRDPKSRLFLTLGESLRSFYRRGKRRFSLGT
jgi:lipid II:glycine glycyltransferase (peptidoglycan interpeptide bridge formation enzyme)